MKMITEELGRKTLFEEVEGKKRTTRSMVKSKGSGTATAEIKIYISTENKDETEKKEKTGEKTTNGENKRKPLTEKIVSRNNSKSPKPKAKTAKESNEAANKENKPPGKPATAKNKEEEKVKGNQEGKKKKKKTKAEEPKVGGNKPRGKPKPTESKSKEKAKKSGRTIEELQVPENGSSTQPEKNDNNRNVDSPNVNQTNSNQERSNPINKNFQMDRDIAVLETFFPNIDPAFLKAQYLKMKRSVEETVNLISVKKTNGEAPSKTMEPNKIDVEVLHRKYTTDFTVETFLKTIPDPWNYFLNTELHNSIRYAEQSVRYLKGKFPRHYVQTIQNALIKSEYSLYRAHKELSNKRNNFIYKMRMTNRVKTEISPVKPTELDFQFLQEVAFIEHETEIIQKLKQMETEKYTKFKDVLKSNRSLRCLSCSDRNLTWENMTCCTDNHIICRECINSHIKDEISNGNFHFKCPIYCQAILSLDIIQDVLSPELLAIIVRKNQWDELRSAGIEDVIHCPRCYYIKVMPSATQTVFHCMNPVCLTVSCRRCKRESHEPLECDEVEEGQLPEIKFEIMPIICHLCNKEFIKDENSNKLVCSCGTIMCYMCRQPYPECPHFKFGSLILVKEDLYLDTSFSGLANHEDIENTSSSNVTFCEDPTENFPENFTSSDSEVF